jgi:hypothetical protein
MGDTPEEEKETTKKRERIRKTKGNMKHRKYDNNKFTR